MQRILFSRPLTVFLCINIIFLAFGITQAQYSTPQSSAAQSSFPLQISCAVLVRGKLSEVCIETQPGATVQISVSYCDVGEDRSPPMVADMGGMVRWLWNIDTDCRGNAVVMVREKWRGMSVMEMESAYVQ